MIAVVLTFLHIFSHFMIFLCELLYVLRVHFIIGMKQQQAVCRLQNKICKRKSKNKINFIIYLKILEALIES